MPTDPFVAESLDDEPRQLRNLAPGVALPPAAAWRGGRPAELTGGQPRTGALLGRPGPNVGYALSLAERWRGRLALGAHESEHDALAVVAEVAMERAASFGRAPVATDLGCAALVLGYDGAVDDGFVEWRAEAVHGASHEYAVRRSVCDAVPMEDLRLTPAGLASRAPGAHDALRRNLHPPRAMPVTESGEHA